MPKMTVYYSYIAVLHWTLRCNDHSERHYCASNECSATTSCRYAAILALVLDESEGQALLYHWVGSAR